MASIVDTFDTDPHGTRWQNLTTRDVESYASGQWTIDAASNSYQTAYYHTTQLDGLTQYAKVTLAAIGNLDHGEIVLRSTGVGSDGYYSILFSWIGLSLSAVVYNDDDGWLADLATSTNLDITAGQSIAVTITGTGTNTVIRLWRNPTNNSPTAVDGWDSAGDTADITFSASGGWSHYADTGRYVGLACQNEDNVFDNFYAGDVGVSSLSPSVSDVIGVSDSVAAIISGLKAAVSDTIAVSDAAAAALEGPCSVGISDTLNISDAVSVILSVESWQASGRYLIDENGDPVLLICRSPQGLAVTASTTEMDTYCSTIADQGFNCIQVHVIAGSTFGGGDDYGTYDDIHPFTSSGDISTPNSTYFSRLDTLVSTANTYGIYVMLNAAECIDALSLWKSNGNTKCYNWGVYLGNRYKDDPNIIWVVGNDFQTWASDQDGVDALINVINGIQSVDTNHSLYTAWLDYYHSASRDSTDFNAECTLDFAYTYYIAYDLVETEYALSPAKPIFLGETYYENYNVAGLTGTPFIIRKQNYWSMLAGACGITYNSDNWRPVQTGWVADLSITGALEIAYFKALFEAYSWWLLVPDTDDSVMTAGHGTKETGTVQPDDCSYANCARASDGSVIIAYLPTSRQVTIDMTKITGDSARARWYDPTDGTYTAIGIYSPTGTRNFTPDTGDWVLVIDAITGLSVSVSDTIGISDTFPRDPELPLPAKSIDLINIVEAVTSILDSILPEISDTIAIADIVAGVMSITAESTDVLTVVDIVNATISTITNIESGISDLISISDAVIASIVIGFAISDSLGIIDSAAVSPEALYQFSDDILVQDSIFVMLQAKYAFSDTIEITDRVRAALEGATIARRNRLLLTGVS